MLYFVLFIAVTNILGYLAIEDYQSLIVFVTLSALTSYFSKNMIIVLSVAIAGTNILYANARIRETFKGKTNKKKPKKDGFGQRNVPSSKPAKAAKAVKAASEEEESDGEEDEVNEATRVDYAATMEQAYDNLNKMLGKGGMKNLTKDTQGLMDQQKDLMKQLKDFAPLMDQAGNMLEKLGGMDNLKGLMGKMNLGGLTGGKK